MIVVAGSPGCHEDTSTGKSPIGVATFIREYGYGHLQVFNATTVTWGWEQTGLRDLATGQFKVRGGRREGVIGGRSRGDSTV